MPFFLTSVCYLNLSQLNALCFVTAICILRRNLKVDIFNGNGFIPSFYRIFS